ncbi:EamA domain-containing membrane protein RarD [Lentibacillus halodurans]|uniref:EamA domain-containing membrane protein RarD n=1 Tax=Lentibacillus halodurans TaxID=237679 RepID=A0A1I0YAN3_9BACI|nr:DMT family transporter [Lentibacillus halodurans]SFB10252.1 EamA domain-containing membrane protein RarD [Lentibacillus halodurans]
MSDRNKGIILLLVSALGFSLMGAFVKLSGDLPTTQKAFFRNIIAAIITLGFVFHHKERLFGKKENQKLLLSRSALGAVGIVLNFYAIDHLVLSDAEMLNKLSPFILIIFCAIFLKEKARRFQVIAVIVAFAGALFIIQPEFSVDVFPYIVGVLGAVFAAGAYTLLRVLGNKEKHYTVVFYFSSFTTVLLLPFTILLYEPMSLQQWVYLILAGACATIGQFGVTLAYKFAPASEISIFFYSTVVYSALLSIVLFGQIPTLISVIGYIIIFGSSFYMFLKNNLLDSQGTKQKRYLKSS